jgi:hypothetical protein
MKLPLILAASVLPMMGSCSTTSRTTAQTGLVPYEREEAVKRQPLSDDKNSPLNDMTAADGKVGMTIAQF